MKVIVLENSTVVTVPEGSKIVLASGYVAKQKENERTILLQAPSGDTTVLVELARIDIAKKILAKLAMYLANSNINIPMDMGWYVREWVNREDA